MRRLVREERGLTLKEIDTMLQIVINPNHSLLFRMCIPEGWTFMEHRIEKQVVVRVSEVGTRGVIIIDDTFSADFDDLIDSGRLLVHCDNLSIAKLSIQLSTQQCNDLYYQITDLTTRFAIALGRPLAADMVFTVEDIMKYDEKVTASEQQGRILD